MPRKKPPAGTDEAAQRELVESRQLLRDIIDTVPARVFWKDLDSRYLGCNLSFALDAGLDSPDDLIGKDDYDMGWREQADRYRADDRAVMESGVPKIGYEEPQTTPEGGLLWLRTSKIPLRDAEGKIYGILGTYEDITERKKTEQTLDFERRQLLSIFDSIDQVIYTVDPDTYEVLYANPALKRMQGSDPTGKPCYKEFQGLDAPCSFCTNSIIAANQGAPYTWEYRNPAIGRDFVLIDRMIKWPDGRDVRFELAIDVTDRKRAEEDNRKIQDQLLQAQKMESVGRLAGGMAHDCNNMLGVILGRVELALAQVDQSQPLRGELQEIRKAAERSAAFIRQLLAFARRQTASPRVLDLNETVSGLLEMLGRLIGEQIEIAWKPGAELWPVSIDPAQVDQIMVNLAANARDAIGGSGRVTIETANTVLDESWRAVNPEFAPGDYVLLAVGDDGCGMDKQVLDNLFEPFFTTKDVGKGTGLGLATVYGIVKQNDGLINVYSEPGAGSVFKIYMPRATADSAELQPPRPVEAEQPKPARGSETVLLVEDEESVLSLGRIILERLGYTVLAALSPTEALVLAGRHGERIDLLITDVVMPGMNGRQLYERIAAMWPGIGVLFISGYTSEAIACNGEIEAGAGFLQKPFTAGTLAAVVREMLDR